MFCSSCGHNLSELNGKFCSSCGRQIRKIDGEKVTNNRPIRPYPKKSDNKQILLVIGAISIFLGPAIAVIMAYNEYQRIARVWGSRFAWAAVENMFLSLAMVSMIGIIVGVVLIVASQF